MRENFQIIFSFINFCEEALFKYFARIKLNEFFMKYIFHVAVFLRMSLKRVLAGLARDLVSGIQKLTIKPDENNIDFL